MQHHAPAPGYARLLRDLKKAGCPLLGLTATPVRGDVEDQRRLSFLFDDTVAYQITRKELTERGILATPSFQTVKTQVNLEKEFTAEDYKHLERYGEIGPAVLARLSKHAGRNELIVKHYLKERQKFGPTIVFAADTFHATTLVHEFKKQGFHDVDHVDYARKDAQAIIARYQKEKKPEVLVNVEMLTEGFDAPHTRTVFIARPTRSEGLLTQVVGRALRPGCIGGALIPATAQIRHGVYMGLTQRLVVARFPACSDRAPQPRSTHDRRRIRRPRRHPRIRRRPSHHTHGSRLTAGSTAKREVCGHPARPRGRTIL